MLLSTNCTTIHRFIHHQVVERRRLIEVEEQEVLRKEKELVANVNRPAEAEKYKLETIAKAQRYGIHIRCGLLCAT